MLAALGGLLSVSTVPRVEKIDVLDQINQVTMECLNSAILDTLFAESPFSRRVRIRCMVEETGGRVLGNFYFYHEDGEKLWNRWYHPGRLKFDPARLPA